MAILNHFTTACWRNFQGDRLNKQLFFILRALHKSAASEAGGEAMSEGLITPADVAAKTTIRTLKEMPGPSTLSNLIEFFWRDGFSRIHEIQMEHRRKYGKIFKSRFGPQLVVSVADRGLVADVLRAEGRIHILRSQESDGATVLNMNDLFFKYAMEGVAAILYESRLGCLENEIPQETQEYISALHLMFSSFKTTMYAGAIPKWLRPVIPKPWEEFCLSWDGLFKFSCIHVDKRLSEIKSQLERGEEVKGGLLTHMLITKEMSMEEIYANLTEMLLAGVDTTSFTLSWASYLLARHPHIQQQIFTEVTETLGPGAVATAEDVPRLPLIRGLVKETLRLFPVLPGNGRITQDDLVVGEYFIPKGTQLALCHYSTSFDEENFANALDFRPDRWIRKDSTDRVDNFGSIPFGYGIRSCIGKRIAELEMHLALTRLIQSFHIGMSPLTADVKAKTHGLLCPAEPIHLQFIDREN
ncbi:cytochrome P450 27C1 isoform X2 [Centropristis striata]|uniref:cytochrome P450 27C1 isoform X2 n=1 Tax=Centropristis striata TaxID=184440 RepID=UPI0027DFB73E|nr:cytochrome P450 27C1 isoform X2 [Centropristis striata]